MRVCVLRCGPRASYGSFWCPEECRPKTEEKAEEDAANEEEAASGDAAEATSEDFGVFDVDALAAADLAALNCSDAGIQSLTGLEQFTQIQSMKLSSNNIRNLLIIERLTALRQLWLDDNDVVDPIPVLRMTALKELNLAGNLRLQCPDPSDVPRHLSLNLPDHCTRS